MGGAGAGAAAAGAACLPPNGESKKFLASQPNCREADFYALPELAIRARTALAQQQQPAAAGEETPSDVPANAALEGSVRCGQLLGPQLARLSGSGSPAAAVLDAVFLETGFQPPAALGEAQAALLQQLNATVSRVGRGGAFGSWVLGGVRRCVAQACGSGAGPLSLHHAEPPASHTDATLLLSTDPVQASRGLLGCGLQVRHRAGRGCEEPALPRPPQQGSLIASCQSWQLKPVCGTLPFSRQPVAPPCGCVQRGCCFAVWLWSAPMCTSSHIDGATPISFVFPA